MALLVASNSWYIDNSSREHRIRSDYGGTPSIPQVINSTVRLTLEKLAGVWSGPVVAVEAAVLNGFGEVLGGHGGGVIEVGHGARDFEDAVVGAGGEAHAADGHFEGALAGIVERADLADIAGRHAGVVEAARLLYGASLFHTGADFGR